MCNVASLKLISFSDATLDMGDARMCNAATHV